MVWLWELVLATHTNSKRFFNNAYMSTQDIKGGTARKLEESTAIVVESVEITFLAARLVIIIIPSYCMPRIKNSINPVN